jgi:uncharacterized protein
MASDVNWRLCDAAEEGDVAGISAAVLAGADTNAFDRTNGMTPLHRAAINGHVAAIAALLAAGARADGTSSIGNTPLMLGVLHGSTAALDALLAAGANTNHVNNGGYTALHWASMHGHPDATCVLLDAGARTDMRNKHGQQPVNVVRADFTRCCSMRTGVTLLRHRVALHRCALTRTPTRLPNLPSAPCSPPLSPGPAVGLSPSPATGWYGSGG